MRFYRRFLSRAAKECASCRKEFLIYVVDSENGSACSGACDIPVEAGDGTHAQLGCQHGSAAHALFLNCQPRARLAANYAALFGEPLARFVALRAGDRILRDQGGVHSSEVLGINGADNMPKDVRSPW